MMWSRYTVPFCSPVGSRFAYLRANDIPDAVVYSFAPSSPLGSNVRCLPVFAFSHVGTFELN